MIVFAVIISKDHRAFVNAPEKPPIEPVITLYVLPDAGVDYIAIDAPDDNFPPRTVHLESPIGDSGWHEVEVTGTTAATLSVWPLTLGDQVDVQVVP